MLSLALMGLRTAGRGVAAARACGIRKRANGGRTNLITAGREELRKMRGRDIAMIFQEPIDGPRSCHADSASQVERSNSRS